MKVWLDDRRSPRGDDWTWVTTPDEVIELLRSGQVEEMSLDHDLGIDVGQDEKTGYDVLAWLEEEIGMGRWRFPLPKMKAHSSNPAAFDRMERAITAIKRLTGTD